MDKFIFDNEDITKGELPVGLDTIDKKLTVCQNMPAAQQRGPPRLLKLTFPLVSCKPHPFNKK